MKCSVSYPRLEKAVLSLATAQAPSLRPMTRGVRPQESLAAMIPSSVSRSIEQEPSIVLNTFSIPSTKLLPWIIKSETSSVGLIFPLLNSLKGRFISRRCFEISS